MTSHRSASSPSRPRPVPGSSTPDASGSRSPAVKSSSRTAFTARLASPVPSSNGAGTPNIRQVPIPDQILGGTESPLAGAESSSSRPGPGRSALAAALQNSVERSPSRFGTPPIRSASPGGQESPPRGTENQAHYGSLEAVDNQGFGRKHRRSSLGPNEDPEVVKRHLVQPSEVRSWSEAAKSRKTSAAENAIMEAAPEESIGAENSADVSDEEFSSLKLQGGDITRPIYKWTEGVEAQSLPGGRGKRSSSFNVPRPEPESAVLDINSIKVPGGFRRNYIRRTASSRSPTTNGRSGGYGSLPTGGHATEARHNPRLFTNNFIEFLSLYGHFAGEDLEDDELLDSEDASPEGYEEGGYFTGDHGGGDDREPGEGSALLTPRTPGGRRRRYSQRESAGTNSPMGAALLLLKSFVGTGVLFLPKAYLNGGMLFSNLVLLFVAALSYYCFILLVNTRLKVNGSFGDIGGLVYGKSARNLILASIVLSQVGFVSAYIVFTSENLQAFVLAVSRCKSWLDIKSFILMQLVIFLPLSLIRDITKLGGTALVADFFILLGLLYLYYYDIRTLVTNHGVADIKWFNSNDWTLFIGTAVFTFEGIGLIIPIQESMKKPTKFPAVLAIVMVIITFIFVSMGAISYAAYGSATRTVIILNLPQDDKLVNAIQLLYSLAILLSTPLQLFPAIRIMENELFTRSGKHNRYIKWQKNVFRFVLVMVCAAIAWGGAGDLDKFVSLIGSLACVPLVYIYPVSSPT